MPASAKVCLRGFLGRSLWVSRAFGRGCPTLSRRPLWRCICRPMVTSIFVGFVEAGYGELMIPPPPSKRWSARLVHRAWAPDQRFRVRAEVEDRRFSGLFLGTCSTLPCAAPCGWEPRTRPLTCQFAARSGRHGRCPRAAPSVPYAEGSNNWVVASPRQSTSGHRGKAKTAQAARVSSGSVLSGSRCWLRRRELGRTGPGSRAKEGMKAQAAMPYSWMVPPRTSRRVILRAVAGRTGLRTGWSRLSARWGLAWL